MFFLTSIYLVCELGFSARLLDVVSEITPPDELEAIEKWGRVISGIALTLAVWGMLVFPLARRFVMSAALLIPVLALTATISLVATWNLQRRLVENPVNSSSGEMRRIATQLRITMAAAYKGAATIGGLSLDDKAAETKAFGAIFPAYVISRPPTDEAMGKLITSDDVATAIMKSDALPKIVPPPPVIWERVFLRITSELKSRYEQGNLKYREGLATIPDRQREMWDDYKRKLDARGYTPETAKNIDRKTFHSHLRQEMPDIEIPTNWVPDDQVTFNRKVMEHVRRKLDAEFSQSSQDALGFPVPPGLPASEFCQHPTVQRKMRQELNLPQDMPISCEANYEDFRDRMYPVLIRSNRDLLIKSVMRPASDFEDGEDMGEVGKRALTSVLVPPIALGFSLLGAVIHFFKVINYATLLIFPASLYRSAVIYAGVALIVVYPYAYDNRVTRSSVYMKIENRKKSENTLGSLTSVGYRWMIQAEAFCYPVNNLIRIHVLRDYKFDRFPFG